MEISGIKTIMAQVNSQDIIAQITHNNELSYKMFVLCSWINLC